MLVVWVVVIFDIFKATVVCDLSVCGSDENNSGRLHPLIKFSKWIQIVIRINTRWEGLTHCLYPFGANVVLKSC